MEEAQVDGRGLMFRFTAWYDLIMFVSGGWKSSSWKVRDFTGCHGTRWLEAGWATSSLTKMRSSTLDEKFRVGKRGMAEWAEWHKWQKPLYFFEVDTYQKPCIVRTFMSTPG